MKKKFYTFLNESVSFGLKDFIILSFIVLLYGILSFYRLGNYDSPNTFFRSVMGDEIVFEFDDTTHITRMMYFNGERESHFNIYSSNDNQEYEFVTAASYKGTFTWDELHIGEDAKYIKFEILDNSSLGEVAFYQQKELLSYSTINSYLSDEEDTIPKQISYMNSSYFDEVYFARTAYQYYIDVDTYEWTHPPLGKIIQAIPIFITHHFSPFTYRFMGNLAGILMLVVMYLFGAVLFKKRGYAILSSLIMAFDTFHFAQTRMGTVDSHLVLFIMISALFMVLYIKKDKNFFLLFSGLFFGLSICVKWTGFYAGLGLAILYFINFFLKKKSILDMIAKGTIFFVFIPLVLYCSWFLLFPKNLYYTDNLKTIVEENKSMYEYHAHLSEDHFFSSAWYSWPISYKPVWYHQQDLAHDYEESISGVGNLFIWIAGIFGFIYACYKIVFKKDKNSFYLVVMMLSLWLPYVFIGRIMFLYHYFPVLPFLFLSIVSLLRDLTDKLHLKFMIPIFLFAIILFFITYYPVVSGMPIPKKYARDLELFDSWYFQN